MRFNTEAERMAHPQARLIPNFIWRYFFHNELSETILGLMRADVENLMFQAQAVAPQLRSDKEKQRAWLAIALSHPELSSEQLRQIAHIFELSESYLFMTAITWGSIAFFEVLVKDHLSAGQLQAMIASHDYDAFCLAASGGHLGVVNRLLELSSPAGRQAMVAADDYYAFRGAAEKGHLEVVNRLLELSSPAGRQAMIASHNYHAFRGAASGGHLEVINSLAQKYGAQFTSEPAFTALIKTAFAFKNEQEAHVLNFGYVCGQLLEAPKASSADTSRPSEAGFFASAASATGQEIKEEASTLGFSAAGLE